MPRSKIQETLPRRRVEDSRRPACNTNGRQELSPMKESRPLRARTRVSRTIQAPRKAVYAAFVDPEILASWLPPEGMSGRVHAFEPCEGGRFHMSLVYQNPAHSPRGKTSDDTDTFQARFVALVPDETIAWAVEFESDDSQFAGEMRVTFSLEDRGEGTEVIVLCDDIPTGVRLEDNEMGCRSSLQNLAALFE
jgi:uncharacterized protein YndB with AHSA1/START domain